MRFIKYLCKSSKLWFIQHALTIHQIVNYIMWLHITSTQDNSESIGYMKIQDRCICLFESKTNNNVSLIKKQKVSYE